MRTERSGSNVGHLASINSGQCLARQIPSRGSAVLSCVHGGSERNSPKQVLRVFIKTASMDVGNQDINLIDS
jgi:hypothetical protein